MNFEDFLTHKGKDFKGRNLKDIWSFSDMEIETNHDFIQIVFPLNKPSQSSFHGFYLHRQDLIDQIKNNKEATDNIIKSSQWFISFLKRKAKVKDTGNFLPGHGGILDRLDGIFLGVPLGFLTFLILGQLE